MFAKRFVSYALNAAMAVALGIAALNVTSCYFYWDPEEAGSPDSPDTPDTPGTPGNGNISGHAYVEMGDGLKWATCNLGAKEPQEYGDYFAWGETKPYYTEGHGQDNPCNNWYSGKSAGYDWKSYSLTNGAENKMKKYCCLSSYGNGGYTDKLTELQAADDAATQNWKGSWRIPTAAEWEALRNQENFDWTWTDNYNGTGSKGMVVTSKITGYKGNSIFLPTTSGFRAFKHIYMSGIQANYWSATLYEPEPNQAIGTTIKKVTNKCWADRCGGFLIRPVSK